MRRLSVIHIKGPEGQTPFWMPWGMLGWTGKSLLFLFLLLGFLALFCLPGHLVWLLWILLLLFLLLTSILFFRKKGVKPHTGDVQVLLEWETDDDLDLHVMDPAGEEIYYGHNRSASGGELDVDANADSTSMARHPKENVYWPRRKAPLGTYKVSVRLFRLRGEIPIFYRVKVKYGRKVNHFNGAIQSDGATNHVCTFNL